MHVYRKFLNGVLISHVIDGIPQLTDASNFQKAANLAGALGRAANAISRGNPIGVSNKERDRRMAICATCEFFTGKTCRKCGCHIRFKAKLQTEHCPIGKW